MRFITQVLLPKQDNGGQPFGREHYAAFHARMIHRFGGWTRKGRAEGAWLSPSGTLYTDDGSRRSSTRRRSGSCSSRGA
jgi:hypothetical protein